MERTGVDNLISYWNASLCAQLSPSAFYEQLEDEIQCEELPDLDMTRSFLREGGWFSARREYLRIRWNNFVFDICGFPVGRSFTVSWWLGTIENNVGGLFFEIPLLGEFLRERISPVTYYIIDAEASFQRAIHNAVLRVVDHLTEQNELPRLMEMEREPVMAEFYE